MQYEYKLVAYPTGPAGTNTQEDMTAALNALGKDGWIVCAIVHPCWVFYREKKDEASNGVVGSR